MPKDDAKIFPIFNQDDDISRRFASLEKNIAEANYNFYAPFESYVNFYKNFDNLSDSRFAFGAFHGDEMLGFIKGYKNRGPYGRARISRLCVLSEFQKNGIGGKLLAAAEKSLSVDTKIVDLVPAKSAKEFSPKLFYEKNGYCNYNGGTGMYKILEEASKQPGVAPIFQVSVAIKRQFIDSHAEELAEHVNKRHDPMFAYIKDGAVVGYLSASFQEDNTMEIVRLQVHEDFQFIGIGRSLFQTAQQYAIHKGSHRIELMHTEESKRFYQKMGMWKQGNFTMDKVIGCRS